MAEVEDEIADAGAAILWVLEESASLEPGTADLCMEALDQLGDPSTGWCVGDGQTEPETGVFDDSPFSVYRGFDMIVPRSTMEIVWASSHGSPSGNDNVNGAAIVSAIEDVVQ